MCVFNFLGLVWLEWLRNKRSIQDRCHWYYMPWRIHFRNIIQSLGFMSQTVSYNRVWLYRSKQERQQQVLSLSSKHRQCTNLWTLCKPTAAVYDWAIHTLCWSAACHPANIYLKYESVQRTPGKEASSVYHSGSTRCDVLQNCGWKHRKFDHNKAPSSHLILTVCHMNTSRK